MENYCPFVKLGISIILVRYPFQHFSVYDMHVSNNDRYLKRCLVRFFLLLFACRLFYFCLTFVCPFCVFYQAPLAFLYIFRPQFFTLTQKCIYANIFCFSFQLQGKAPACIDWGQFLALLSNSIFPVCQDFDKYLFTFCFWIEIFSNQDGYLHFLFRLEGG